MSWITNALASILIKMFDLTQNYWLAIILFGIITRVILMPFLIAQFRSTATIQALQPEMDRIKKRFKGDDQRQNQELLELYRKNKVNPLSGCLLLAIQLPIWWAMFAVLRMPSLVEAFATHPSAQLLFWNLSKPDPYYIFPIITAASTYLMSKTMGTGQTTDPTARTMNYVTPVMMLVLTVKYPVALSLYFVTSNVLQIIQQLLTPKPKLITGEAD